MSLVTSKNYSDVFIIKKVPHMKILSINQTTRREKRLNNRKLSRDENINSCVILVFCEKFNENPEFLKKEFQISEKSFVFRRKKIDLELLCKLFWQENEELENYLIELKNKTNKIVEAVNISQILNEIKKRMIQFLIFDSKLSFILKRNSNFEHINNFHFGTCQALPIANSKNIFFNKIYIEISPCDYKILSEINKDLNFAEPILNSDIAVRFLTRKMTENI
jgi:hypothetical protein